MSDVFTDHMNENDLDRSRGARFHTYLDWDDVPRRVLTVNEPTPDRTIGAYFVYRAPGFNIEIHSPRRDRPDMGPDRGEGWWALIQWWVIERGESYKTVDGYTASITHEWCSDDGGGDLMIGIASYERYGFHGSPAALVDWLIKSQLAPSPIVLALGSAMHDYDDGPSTWSPDDHCWLPGPAVYEPPPHPAA